ncbi:MAG: galactokinase [Rhodothermaceae bacterium]|nr:galactokinase [Rhodothermaceae bacterium]
MTKHSDRYAGETLLVRSPGRVNLIGEHTDYNNGFVLPAAIDKAIILALSKNSDNLIRLNSADMEPGYFETPVLKSYKKTGVHWADYIIGVVDELQKDGFHTGGFDCTFGGDIPIGAGLSSSAALEGGVAFGLARLFDFDLSLLALTKIAQRAENNFVGVQCGIMDQFASLHGEKDRVIKLDCRSLDYELYPFQWDHTRVLLCDTKVRRTLAGSEYNIRRRQCEEGVAIINKSDPSVRSLRDVTFHQLESHKDKMDAVVYRRCRYVLEENQRVTDACTMLLENDLAGFGQKMYQSHYGLRDDYEVSCRELDILVEAAEQIDGVLGARMMGGGFGGCTINLVLDNTLEDTIRQIQTYYHEKTGKEPGFHIVQIGQGTHLVTELADDTKSS